MNTKLALAAATMVLAPVIAAASQPAQPANQSSTETQSPAKQTASTKKDSAQTCDKAGRAIGKAADAKADHDPSAMPGKDTGWVPPPRKRSASESDTACAAQSH
jgi:hypothetical protein